MTKVRSHSKPRVVVIATGGTVSGIGVGPLDFFNYASAGRFMRGDEMIDRIPELKAYADILVVPYENIASSDIDFRHWLELVNLIQKICDENPDTAGIVVTHGTSSLEETAYFLNLTLKVACPVVLTGAQRPASALGTDAGLNILNAVLVAIDATSRGMGLLVVLNGEINAARDVTKTSTFRSQAFQSQDLGVLGFVDGDEVTFYRRPHRTTYPHTEFDGAKLLSLPRVDIISSYVGADAALIDAAIAAGCAGLVAAGMAPGVVPDAQLQAYKRASKNGTVVVMSSRVMSGRITSARTAIPEAGMIAADTLSPQKSRLLLMLGLSITRSVNEIERMFALY